MPECDVEICGNGFDDDCDGDADCADDDCSGPGNGEICFDGQENECGTPVTPDSGNECINEGWMPYDDPADGADNDGDGEADDDTPVAEECEKCGECEGYPVNLMNQQVFIGPHEDIRIQAPQGGNFDLLFSRTWDSKRAQRDDDDDKRVTASGDQQRPWQRVLGPGWRHSYEIRLILENVVGGRPSTVTFDRPERRTRLFAIDVVAGAYGRVPGRAISAQRSGTTWTVLDDDGTIYEFEEGTGAGTELHPWGVNNPNELDPFLDTVYAARLRNIIPSGQTKYRIRLYHEEDLGPLPSSDWRCNKIVGASTTCSTSRGLLAVVAQEWLDGSTWRRGSSIVLHYSQMVSGAGTQKRQLMLTNVEEGADYDDSVADATDLVRFNYTTDLSWRWLLAGASSCVDRTDASGDASAGPCTENSSKRWLYEAETTISGVESQHLIRVVSNFLPTTAATFDSQPIEEHNWGFADGVFFVDHHMSPQLILSQSGQSRSGNGTKDWTRNDVLRRVTFERGRPVEMQRCEGGDCQTLTRRTYQASSANNRYALGSRLSVDSDGIATIRELDENGNSIVEAEVVASGPDPTVHLDTVGGTDVSFSTDVAFVRRVTRNYFSGDGTRRLAMATLSITNQPQVTSPTSPTAARKFPLLSSTNWSPASVLKASRLVPNNNVTIGGASWFYDVDVTDYDGGGTLNTYNESSDRTPAWSHSVQTGVGGVMLYRSTRSTVDAFGRVTATEAFAAPRASATNVTPTRISLTEIGYEPVTATPAARNRGRRNLVTAYATVTNTTQTDSRVTWQTCAPTSTFSPYSESGEVECFDQPQTPANFRTQITVGSKLNTAMPPVPDSTLPRRRVTSRTGLPSTFEEVSGSGAVITRGTVGGNSLNFFYFLTDAASAQSIFKVEERDGATTPALISTRFYGVDTNGRVNAEETSNAAATLRRKTASTFDDSGNVLTQKRFVVGTTALTTTHVIDEASGRTTSTTEPDGDVEIPIFDTSGIDAGRLRQTTRKADAAAAAVVVREFAYDAWGRTTSVWNGSSTTGALATVLTPEGNGVFREVLSGVPTSTDGLTKETVTSVFGNRVIEDEVTKTGPTGVTARATRLQRDALGRPQLLCTLNGTACNGNVVQWFYDAKPAAWLTTPLSPYSICTARVGAEAKGACLEGESTAAGRTLALTNNNQTGRLAYVVHPAGVTVFEYDASGRVTAYVQHDAPLSGGNLVAASMRVWEVSYTATGEIDSIRYPSGRRLQNSYSADKRAPDTVLLKSNVNGVNDFHRLVSKVKVDVDGSPIAWEWGDGYVPALKHTIDRDLSGRITRIVDENSGDSTKRAEFKYNYDISDPDALREEPSEFEDEGPYAPIITTAASVPLGGLHAPLTHDPLRDMLTEWTDPNGLIPTLVVEPTPPNTAVRRFTEEGVAYTANREQLTGRSPVTLSYSSVDGRVSSVSGGSAPFTSTTVDSRGQLTGYTVGGSAWTMLSDEGRNRWSLSQSGTAVDSRFRYGPSGMLTDYFRRQGTGTSQIWSRDEYSYLLGMPIGVTHEDNLFPLVTSYWLSPDAMGTPRRAFTRGLSLTQIRRVVMNPWGKAALTDERPGGGSPTIGLPKLPFRLPGQLQDEANTAGLLFLEAVVENKYRAYLPDLGQYFSPDPLHQVGVMNGMGPQAYAYGNGQPLITIDPDGRRILSDAASAPILGQLRSTFIGRYINEMDRDSNTDIIVEQVISASVHRDGGGRTFSLGITPELNVCKKRGSSDCKDVIQIEYDPTYDLADWYPDLAALYGNLPASANFTLAHELGHAFWWYSCRQRGSCSPSTYDMAVIFENSARGAPPFRAFH